MQSCKTLLIYSYTKVNYFGIIGSFGALQGLGLEFITIASLEDIENWFNRN
jgi:hypothetical protein